MGFDAIWISPIVEGPYYNGKYATDFTKINSHFGTSEDLKDLVQACHDRNITVMLHIVMNHAMISL